LAATRRNLFHAFNQGPPFDCGAIARRSSNSKAKLALALVFAALLGHSFAQTNAPVHHSRSNRYLIIVETSRAMHRRIDGMLVAVQGLLASRMGGELKNGDSIGLWTYNEELFAGKVPVQQWSEDTDKTLTDHILSYLKGQNFEKQGKLDKVLPPLAHLIKSSAVITAILISDGAEEIHGTAFDDKINNVFKVWRNQQRDSKMPFITVFRGVKGNLTDCSANPVPWVVELPPLPPEPKVANVAAAPQKPPPPAPTLPPLIISGKKHESSDTVTSAQSNTSPTPLPAPASTSPIARSQPTASATALPPPIVLGQAALESSSAAPAGGSTTATAPIPPDHVNPSTISDKSRISQTSAAEPKGATDGALNESRDSNVAASAADLSTKADENATPTATSNARPETPPVATTSSRPTQVAAVTPRSSTASSSLLVLAALFGLVIVLSGVWYWRGRPKTTRPASLITESFDRNRK
jgi:hypothetical protein